jgi:hypothetical protein
MSWLNVKGPFLIRGLAERRRKSRFTPTRSDFTATPAPALCRADAIFTGEIANARCDVRFGNFLLSVSPQCLHAPRKPIS